MKSRVRDVMRSVFRSKQAFRLQPRNSSRRQSSERILQVIPTSDFHL